MTNKQITERLFALQDKKYRDFEAKIIPNIPKETIIGVRTPALRTFAKELYKSGAQEYADFFTALPHFYFEEQQLHAFLISQIKDFSLCINETNRFLPYINNWATCDQLLPKVFKSHKAELLPQVEIWIKSSAAYTVRFAVGVLMQHFLDADFKTEYAERVASVRSDEYYVKMMVAWYFATALAKQYDSVLPLIKENRLEKWTHNKAIQKAIESYRITPEQKEALRALKRA